MNDLELLGRKLYFSSGEAAFIPAEDHQPNYFEPQSKFLGFTENNSTDENFLQRILTGGFYESLLNLSDEPIVVFDLSTDSILFANEPAQQSYRVSSYNLSEISFRSLWKDVREAEALTEILLAQSSVKKFEAVYIGLDQTTINVSINAVLFNHQDARLAIAVISNTTERLRIEQSIIRAKQEWSDTVDAVSDLIILEDSEGNLRRCNKASAEFFRLPYLELIGKSIDSIIQKEENAEITPGLEDRADYLRAAIWEGQLFGQNKWYEITNHALPDKISGQANWVHIIKDITGRKYAEAELRRLYTAIEQAADAILITDLTGSIQYVNASFEKMMGWNRTESVGRKISEIKNGIDEYENTGEIFAALQNGEIWQKTYRATRRNGEVYDEEATISLVRNSVGNPLNYVFVCRDVTETRRLESIAEAVNMMNNVGYIFSGIRHELGNPINSVKTALTVLKQNVGKWQNDQIEVYIERCLTETARVEYLLRTLKTFSMHENLQMQEVCLTAYMKNFISLISEDFHQKNIHITFACEDPIGKAVFDPRALHQVLLNLLTNSADAFENRFNCRIDINLTRRKNRIFFTIADNALGMTDSQLNNIFKPFYTSKTKGTGLGLVIVKSMIGRMNGTISIESTQNIGTKVTFTLETAGA